MGLSIASLTEGRARQEVCLRVEDVDLWFGGTHALNHVDFTVRMGEVLGIIGPNGAGKSSLLNCINGYYRPATGQISFQGKVLTGQRPHRISRLGVGRTFQNIELSPDATVLENVMLGRHIHVRTGLLRDIVYVGSAQHEEARQRERVEDLLSFVGLSRFRHRPVSDLPYGQQKLVELARALAMEPSMLLLDEPTAGMTSEERAEVAMQIKRLRSETGITQVVIEHDVGFIRDLCDSVVVLDFGSVIAKGRAANVLSDPKVIAAYVGEEAQD